MSEFFIRRLEQEITELRKQIKQLESTVAALKQKVQDLDHRTMGSIRLG